MKYNRLDAGAGRGNVSKVLKEKRDPNIVLVPPFIYLIVVRLKFVTLPDLLWGHVLRRFSSLFFPLSFLFSRISQPEKKKGGNSASKFRAYVSNRPRGFPYHFLPFRFTPCHLFIPCLVSHYFSRCIPRCSVRDDPCNPFIGYIYSISSREFRKARLVT